MIDHLDHLVLTTANERACIDFYVGVLGMQLQTFGQGRKALHFGAQKINIHPAGDSAIAPKAGAPTVGALDLCFIASVPLREVVQRLAAHQVAILEGPVRRTGAAGAMVSVYVRDPDGNLVEISEYV